MIVVISLLILSVKWGWRKKWLSEAANSLIHKWPLIHGEKIVCTVKLGNKERFDKEQIGIKELFMDYQPFYTINLLLDKELLPI